MSWHTCVILVVGRETGLWDLLAATLASLVSSRLPVSEEMMVFLKVVPKGDLWFSTHMCTYMHVCPYMRVHKQTEQPTSWFT